MKVCLLFSLVLCMFHVTHEFQVDNLDCIDADGNVLYCIDDFACQIDENGFGQCVPNDALMSPQSVCPSPDEIEVQETEAGQMGDACSTDLECPEEKVCCPTYDGTRCAMMLQAMLKK